MGYKFYSAYSDLQLDFEDDEQMLAFETLFLKHISLLASSDWLQQALSGKLQLQTASINPVTKRKIVGHDHTLNHLTFKFVQQYASRIWPPAEENRSHLSSNCDKQLIVGGQRTRAGSVIQARLERDLDQPCTEQDLVVESIIGRRVREFLIELVKKNEVFPLDSYSRGIREFLQRTAKKSEGPPIDSYSVEQLLQMVVAPRHPILTSVRYPCPHIGCGNVYAWDEALTNHISLAHPSANPPAGRFDY